MLNDNTAGRTLLLAVGSLVLLVPLGTSASAAPPILHEGCVPPAIGTDRYNLWVSACGPTYVVRNTTYTYGVVVKNFGGASFRRIELSVIHYDPITRSSIPYGRGPYNRSDTAFWTLKNFTAGRFFRVNITLPFRQHNDPKGSNLQVEARGYGPSEHRNLTKDVIFKKRR